MKKVFGMNLPLPVIGLCVLLVGCLMLVTCSRQSQPPRKTQSQPNYITVKKASQRGSFSYDGTIAPIRTVSVSSPLDGNIEKLNFNYGSMVKKGQLLVSITSTDLGKNYQQALSGYLTAKEKYNTSKGQIAGAEDLYKSGITSQQTYQSAVSDLNDSYLSYLQAQQALLNVLVSAGINEKDIYLLQISDVAAVKKALTAPLKTITIYAPSDGLALKPEKSASSDDSGISLHKGADIKAGQVLVSLGTMTGILVAVNVDEITINSIRAGDGAVITSPAFPDIILNGEISSVGFQASSDSSGQSTLPTFPVTVTVKNLTPAQQNIIHVGMSAKVEITTQTPATIVIPLSAVHTDSQGQASVSLLDPKTNKVTEVSVQTGATTVDGVTIVSGLKPGDKIVSGN